MFAYFNRVRTWWTTQRALRFCNHLAQLGAAEFEEELLRLAEPGSTPHLSQALRRLSRRERRLLLLYEIRALSPLAIAMHLDISEAETLRELSRAIAHFHREVRSIEETSPPNATERICA